MGLNEDSRPFTFLREKALEFKSTLDSDVNKCLLTLDSKITDLVFNPDSSTNSKTKSKSKNLSAYVEFSKAKYNIYESMKSLVQEIEESWKSQIIDIAKEFLENVELFLANTKLEGPVKASEVQDKRKCSTPSLYPSLLSTAKHIPVLNSLFPSSQAIDTDLKEKDLSMNGSSQKILSPKKSPVAFKKTLEEEPMLTDEEIDIPEPPPQKRGRRGRKPKNGIVTSTSAKKTPGRQVQFQEEAEDLEPNTTLSAVPLIVVTPVRRGRGRKSLAATPVLTPTRQKNSTTVIEDDTDETQQGNAKNVQFSVGMDINEDLDVYSPEINFTRSAPRRKTVMNKIANNLSILDSTPEVTRRNAKGKRIMSCHGNVLAPSKRFKPTIVTPPKSLGMDYSRDGSDLLEGDITLKTGHYSPWIYLSDLDGSVPPNPGVYEMKVGQAKRAAYIGGCDSLRQRLTLHKLKQKTGHKHLDKFIERNAANVLVRYEVMPSTADAKAEEDNRVQSFKDTYHTTPAYN